MMTKAQLKKRRNNYQNEKLEQERLESELKERRKMTALLTDEEWKRIGTDEGYIKQASTQYVIFVSHIAAEELDKRIYKVVREENEAKKIIKNAVEEVKLKVLKVKK